MLIDKATFDARFGPGVSEETASINVSGRGAELSVQYLPDSLLNTYYKDKQKGCSPPAGQVYGDLQDYYPNFTDLYPDLWQRMDAKLANFGSVQWPPCEFYDLDLLRMVRTQIGLSTERNLTPDQLDNNSFATATPIKLRAIVGELAVVTQKDEKVLRDLNFSGPDDQDYFCIEFVCSDSDDVYQGMGPSQKISDYLGLWVTHYPASLSRPVIERYRSARGAVGSFSKEEDLPPDLSHAEVAAVEELALAPCARAEELLGKLRILLEVDRAALCGGRLRCDEPWCAWDGSRRLFFERGPPMTRIANLSLPALAGVIFRLKLARLLLRLARVTDRYSGAHLRFADRIVTAIERRL